MKKFFLAFTLCFISISSSFAYQQMLSAGPPVNYAGTNVSINMNCSYVYFQCIWSNSSSGTGSGSTVAYSSDATLIGEYSYYEGSNSQSYTSGVFGYRYWGSVQMYLSAFNCTAQALLEWMP